jgi:3-keto-disaccharide hydrolase
MNRTRTIVPLLVIAVGLLSAAAPAAEKAAQPFNGKNMDGWVLKGPKERSQWTVGTAMLDPKDAGKLVITKTAGDGKGELINVAPHSVDVYSQAKFGDGVFEVEVMVPRGSNSGIYMMGEYEVQVLDSYGKKEVGPGDLGGIYSVKAPTVNAAKAPGQWQTFVIDFRAPRFDADGKKTADAKFVKVTLNGQVIHENVEVHGPTGGALTGKEHPTGPIMFQGDHGAVAFRNIKVTPIGAE